MPIEAMALTAAILLSVLPPFVIVWIRQSVKSNRQEVVRDLEAVFSKSDGQDEGIIPSFEFVKYKYFFQRNGVNGQRLAPVDHSYISWIVGSIPLIVLLFSLSYIVANTLAAFVVGLIDAGVAGVRPCAPNASYRPLWVWCLCAAFAGGYVFMIRAFFRAINNFDLSPASFVGAFNNLVLGVVIALVIPYVGLSPVVGSDIALASSAATMAAVALSFASGYYPETATRLLLGKSELSNFKRENPSIYKVCLTTPVEIIDGIDTEIRDRLADYHIRSTQNLAAANPLMLFVETPFGVYQIMDWVAQAQLCCSVGSEVLIKLWSLGIRTLFDLERIALDPDCYDEQLLQKVGAILFSGSAAAPAGVTQVADPTSDAAKNVHMIVCSIVARLDDPHVHRLRQIYIRVGDRLGDDNRRFPGRKKKPSDQPSGNGTGTGK